MNTEENKNLLLLVGGIASDTKHIIAKQADQDVRINNMSNRLVKVEKFQWKLIGVTSIIPVILTGFGLVIAYIKS